MSKFKVAIVGSRLKYWEALGPEHANHAALYICEYIWKRRVTCEFISGSSPGGGVDIWAENFCARRFIPFKSFPAAKYTAAEFYKRNRQIAEEANVIVAFCAGTITGGTRTTIRYAKELGKHVVIYIYNNGEWKREEFNAPKSSRP